MSAIRAKGIWKIAVEIRYTVVTHVKVTAFIDKSLLSSGSARLIAEPIKGTKKAAIHITINARYASFPCVRCFIG
jgi:hypothetical protein